MTVAIVVHPREEKYIAIGFAGPESGKGSIIVYDLVKRKVKRSYNTSAIASLAWTNTGKYIHFCSSTSHSS